MPLRANFDGNEIISVGYSDTDWSALKQIVSKGHSLTLPCCHQQARLRTNQDGIKYFIHADSSHACTLKPEKAEHLLAKANIIRALLDEGWKATPEYMQDGCIFDVLATKDNKNIGFVFEWTKMTIEDLSLKYQQYHSTGIRTCWFVQKLARKLRDSLNSILESKQNPTFLIQVLNDHKVAVSSGHRVFGLPDFVNQLLNGKFKICQSYRLAPTQEVEIAIYPTSCWKCKKEQHSYTINQNLKSVCGHEMYLDSSLGSGDDIDKHPAIVGAVKDFLQSAEGTGIHIGEVKVRYSKTVNQAYPSHGCYYCDALFGDFYQITEKMDGLNDPRKVIINKVVNLGLIKQEGDHWCYSPSNQFCS
jgi:hypothetical protein